MKTVLVAQEFYSFSHKYKQNKTKTPIDCLEVINGCLCFFGEKGI